jgi:hypothetical protein
LPVHLPDKHTVLFKEDEPTTALLRRQETKLTACFKMVIDGWRADGKKERESGAPLFYADMPKWYR